MSVVISSKNKITDDHENVVTTVNRVNLSVTDQKVNQVATKSELSNAGWEILSLGLKKEREYQIKLAHSTKDASDLQLTIQKLTELNGQLSTSEKDVVLTDEAIAICKELEEKFKITLLKPEETKVNPVRMSELKAQIGSQNDRLKTKLQTIFSTEIQVMINEINALMESLRTIQKFSDRLMSNVIANQRR